MSFLAVPIAGALSPASSSVFLAALWLDMITLSPGTVFWHIRYNPDVCFNRLRAPPILNEAAQHYGLGPERSTFLRCNKEPAGDASQPLHQLLT